MQSVLQEWHRFYKNRVLLVPDNFDASIMITHLQVFAKLPWRRLSTHPSRKQTRLLSNNGAMISSWQSSRLQTTEVAAPPGFPFHMNLDFLCTWLLGNERLYSRLQRSQVSTQLHSRKAHSSEKSLYWWFNKFDNSIRLKQSTPPMKWKFDWHGSYFQINGIIFNMWEPQDVRKALKICISIDESCRMWAKRWKHAIQYMRDAGCEKSVEDTQSDSDLAADDGDFRDRPSLIWLDAIISAWGSWNEEDAWER